MELRFVTILSIISIVFTLFLIFQNAVYIIVVGTPAYQLANQYLPFEMTSVSEIFIELFLNIIMCLSSIGLLMRFNWARIAYMVTLVLIIVWNSYSNITSNLALNNMIAGYSFGTPMNDIITRSVFEFGISIFVIWKLTTEDIRMEFDR